MNQQIQDIVNKYISDGEYEKALSLMLAAPIDNEEDKSLLDLCKKEFLSQCTTSITEAVQSNDMDKAERTLTSYKKLIGEDSNSILFQTLINSSSKKKDTSDNRSNNNMSNIKIFLTNIFKSFDNVTPDMQFIKSWRMWGAYAVLAIIIILFGCFNTAAKTTWIASIIIAISLFIPILSYNNKRFWLIALILLLIPCIASTIVFNATTFNYLAADIYKLIIPWILSITFIVIYNTIVSTRSWLIRIFVSILLFTVFNSLWYASGLSFCIEWYHKNIYNSPYFLRFIKGANFYLVGATIIWMIIVYISLVGFKKIIQGLVTHKKQIIRIFCILIAACLIIGIILSIKSNHDRKVAEREAIEKARQDSIQAIENARIAAIERARRDSIAKVRRKEQARRDSIDYVEHAGFVAKYAKIGVILTDVSMVSGTSDNGVPSKGIQFSIFNPTRKTIKYVVAVCQPMNSVGDPLSYPKKCSGIGPVESHSYGSWRFDETFPDKNDIIDDIKVFFEIKYTDGTSKIVRWKDAYVEDFKSSWFKGR